MVDVESHNAALWLDVTCIVYWGGACRKSLHSGCKMRCCFAYMFSKKHTFEFKAASNLEIQLLEMEIFFKREGSSNSPPSSFPGWSLPMIRNRHIHVCWGRWQDVSLMEMTTSWDRHSWWRYRVSWISPISFTLLLMQFMSLLLLLSSGLGPNSQSASILQNERGVHYSDRGRPIYSQAVFILGCDLSSYSKLAFS